MTGTTLSSRANRSEHGGAARVEARGLAFLAWLTFRRQLLSKKTVVAIVLVAFLCGVAYVHARGRSRDRDDATATRQDPVARFARGIVMPLYVGFFLPILTMLYAGAAISDERDDRTLVLLLIRPLARWRMYLAKAVGAAPLCLVAGVGGFAAMCGAVPATGSVAWSLFWPAIAMGTMAYGSLYLFVGAFLPRPMIIGVAYALFVESLLGNMPGTIKRASLSFHCKCVIFDAGSTIGLEPRSLAQFVPISGAAATWTLIAVAILLLVAGAWLFHRREYLDLD